MKKIIKNIKGETIAETIIAVSVLAVGITLSATLMSTSLKNINVSKNRVIAVNIAREGLEAVRNIRDTNWLKFSGKRRLCWNHFPGPDVDDTCNGSIPIEPDDYIVYKNVDHRWRLSKAIVDPVDYTPLSTVDIDVTINTDKIGTDDDDADMYNHASIADALGVGYASLTPFSRTITISYLANNGTELAGSVTDEYNRMLITSTVKWTRQEIERTVELKTHLTDYLGRDNLDN